MESKSSGGKVDEAMVRWKRKDGGRREIYI